MNALQQRAWNVDVPEHNAYIPDEGVITAINELGDGERLLTIRPQNGKQVPNGEFVMIMGENGEEAPFSVCSMRDAEDREGPYFQSAIRCIPQKGFKRGTSHLMMNVSGSLHTRTIGDIVYYSGPYGAEMPIRTYAGFDVLVIMAGIGFYPARRILLELEQDRHMFGKIVVLFGHKTPQERYFGELLDQWDESGMFDIRETIDKPMAGWSSHTGFVATLVPTLADIDPLRTVVYIVGPRVIFKPVVAALHPFGIPARHVYIADEGLMRCGRTHGCKHCAKGEGLLCENTVPTLEHINKHMQEVLS